MIIKVFLFLSFYLLSSSAYSANIRVVDMQNLLENSDSLKSMYSLIEKDQIFFLNKFKKEELSLKSQLSEINELELILNNEELEKEVNKYNDSLNKFNIKIKNFNLHYDKQINNLKNIIVNKILEIMKSYSLDNEIDLILDSNHYILSSNSINITDLLFIELNKINIEYNFEKYK